MWQIISVNRLDLTPSFYIVFDYIHQTVICYKYNSTLLPPLCLFNFSAFPPAAVASAVCLLRWLLTENTSLRRLFSSLSPSLRCTACHLLLTPTPHWPKREAPHSPLRSDLEAWLTAGAAGSGAVEVLYLSGCFLSAGDCPRVTSAGSGSHKTPWSLQWWWWGEESWQCLTLGSPNLYKYVVNNTHSFCIVEI